MPEVRLAGNSQHAVNKSDTKNVINHREQTSGYLDMFWGFSSYRPVEFQNIYNNKLDVISFIFKW